MAYLRNEDEAWGTAGLGCGPDCKCGPCRAKLSGFGERYIPADDDEDEEPEQVPPGDDEAPDRTPDSAPTPSAKPGGRAALQQGARGRRRQQASRLGGYSLAYWAPALGGWGRFGAAESPGPFDFYDGFGAASTEQALLLAAIRRGERNLNKLTDMLFYARHPERSGAKLRQEEAGSIQEWLTIRDQLVRPALITGKSAPHVIQPGVPPAAVKSPSITSGFEVDGPATRSLTCILGEQLKGRQIKFIARYLRDLTSQEARAISGAGLEIVSCWELGHPTQRAYFTRAQGAVDGRRAFMKAQAIGQPANTPIYFAVDYDGYLAQDRAAVLDYFEGIRDALNQHLARPGTIGYVIGVYGNGCVLDWCRTQGIARFFWQAFAPGWCDNKNVWIGANLHTFALDKPPICQRRLGRLEGWGNEGGWFVQTGSGQASGSLGHYGWSVKTPASVEGHEVITRKAIGPSREIQFTVAGRPMRNTLSPEDVDSIIAGNRSVDLGWMGTGVLFSLNKDEQRRHSLRREFMQPMPDALADIIGSLRAQHVGILAEPNATQKMRRIGMATHLIQDSFSPAHTERRPGSGWCISYFRNFGRGNAPREHGTPSDPRDEIERSGIQASQATAATRRYLQIVSKAIFGRVRPDPAAVSEAASEFDRFVAEILRLC